jgi:hypothetical protein
MSLSEELLAIHVELKGAKQASEESLALAKSQKEIGTSTASAGKAAEKTSKSTGRLSKIYGALGKAARWGATGLLAGGAAVALWGKKAVDNTVELAKATSGLQKTFGLSTATASTFLSLAKVRGADYDKTAMFVKSFATNLRSAATGSESAIGIFRKLGFSQEDIQKGLQDSDAALFKAADGFQHLEGGLAKGAIAAKLFGKGYAKIFPLLREGSRNFKDQIAEARRFGAVLNGSAIDSSLEFAEAQRRLELANIGLQISFTENVLPSLTSLMDGFGEVIHMLQSPKLSADQKINRIGKKFEHLSGVISQGVAEALPVVADAGGKLGLALAKAVWEAFTHSSFLGKLFIGFWIFKAIGGFSALSTLGAKIGGKLATSLGTKFLETVAPYFAAEAGVEGLGSALSSRMGGLTTLFASSGKVLGAALGLAAAGVIVWEIHQGIKEHALGGLLFPQHISSSGFEAEDTFLTSLGYKVLKSWPGNIVAINPWGKKQHFGLHHGEWETKENGHLTPPHKFGNKPKHSQRPNANAAPRQRANKIRFGENRSDRPIVVVTQIDGKTVAVTTAKHAEDAAALA